MQGLAEWLTITVVPWICLEWSVLQWLSLRGWCGVCLCSEVARRLRAPIPRRADAGSLARVFELSALLISSLSSRPHCSSLHSPCLLLSAFGVLVESIFGFLRIPSPLILWAHYSKISFKRRKCNSFHLNEKELESYL